MRLRSILFTPGDAPNKIAKALASNADAVVLDLEDAVGPANKQAARHAVAALLPSVTRDNVVVRVNARSTAWYLQDLATIAPLRPTAVMLPKCTGLGDLAALDHHLEALETAARLEVGTIGVFALVTETAASLHGLDYRQAPARLRALCFAAEDLSSDLGVAPRDASGAYAAPVRLARASMLAASAAAGVPAIDTPYPDPRDQAGLARELADAVRDGFAGKMCIHPVQVPGCNDAFQPDQGRIAWARKIVDAFALKPDAGVISLEGKMVERLHLRLAMQVLASV